MTFQGGAQVHYMHCIVQTEAWHLNHSKVTSSENYKVLRRSTLLRARVIPIRDIVWATWQRLDKGVSFCPSITKELVPRMYPSMLLLTISDLLLIHTYVRTYMYVHCGSYCATGTAACCLKCFTWYLGASQLLICNNHGPPVQWHTVLQRCSLGLMYKCTYIRIPNTYASSCYIPYMYVLLCTLQVAEYLSWMFRHNWLVTYVAC